MAGLRMTAHLTDFIAVHFRMIAGCPRQNKADEVFAQLEERRCEFRDMNKSNRNGRLGGRNVQGRGKQLKNVNLCHRGAQILIKLFTLRFNFSEFFLILKFESINTAHSM
jgi:hypothetical protein